MQQVGGQTMSERTAALLAEALKLSNPERQELVDGLLNSIDSESSDIDSLSEEDFEKELNRRHEEFLRDPSVGIPFEEVKRLTRVK
jgi:putative addiction module component (TIGR02574 family)